MRLKLASPRIRGGQLSGWRAAWHLCPCPGPDRRLAPVAHGDPNLVPGQSKRPWDVPSDEDLNVKRVLSSDDEVVADFPARAQASTGPATVSDDDWLAGFDLALKASQESEGEGSTKPAPKTKHRYERSDDPEQVFLVGILRKERGQSTVAGYEYNVEESLDELGRLAKAAGLEVVGHTHQVLSRPDPASYIGSGKVVEVADAVHRLGAQTVIFDDELSPAQLRNLERRLGEDVRVCDRTALILDIFSQRAATREGQLQVELAQMQYQLPRLTRMWTHLERQSGAGQVKGAGEKQIELDRRMIKTRMSQLRRDLDSVRLHRSQHRSRRQERGIPVVALVGYTNAGKSTLLNALSPSASVVAQDMLFATLDPTTRRVPLPSGREALLTDTVGFIQKLPTQLVAAFRATLEEVEQADLLLHVVDVSSPLAAAQTQAVEDVLAQLDVEGIPVLTVWNKVDMCADPQAVIRVAEGREDVVAVSASQSLNLESLMARVEDRLAPESVRCEFVIPYADGAVVAALHKDAVVEAEEFCEGGIRVVAIVSRRLAGKLSGYRVDGGGAGLKRRARRADGWTVEEWADEGWAEGERGGEAGSVGGQETARERSASMRGAAGEMRRGAREGSRRGGKRATDPAKMNRRANVDPDVILEGAGVAVGRQRPGGGKKGGGTRGSGSSLFMAATEVDER